MSSHPRSGVPRVGFCLKEDLTSRNRCRRIKAARKRSGRSNSIYWGNVLLWCSDDGDQAYQDELDGKISEEFWARKSSEWQAEKQQILASIRSLKAARPERLLDASRTLELANKAYSLYGKQPPAEKAKLLKMVLSNCSTDACRYLSYLQKAFDVMFQKTKKEEWRARRDSNPRPSASKADALSS